ncbi:MAG: cell division protein FtsW [Candidatus Blackburnbacteria bacterium RIFCSPHIGHO2_01_FULL_43_15b]|uniref:Probable peptidoglycan glycosyltransferase FtsW n=1 Tax=Candidatus Blackburnbacteria bacterium RIFCSPHIGHO2_01_FULL_43_15b TaxID=1797513 RepID=A0A1G1V1N7_9BACT|nr:MAG: cell division protein FtsW [Candidatus Blackburnbacteria bacterium RIFCSPHIGHO2_01_FULL_43_15b]
MRGGIDRLLLMAVLLLVGFGVAMVFDASVADATRTFNDKFFFVKRQLVWITLGLLSMTITSFVNYKFWEKISVPLFGATILLLIVVLIPGIGVSALGASRRIGVGFLGVQPAEIAKLSLVIFLSASLSRDNSLIRFLVPVGIAALLIVIEPDLGTTTIVATTAFAVFFASNAPLAQVGLIGGSGFLAALVLALSSSYRRERLVTFLNPSFDTINSSYHVRQILIALGSGGVWGLGIGQSRQKYLYLPEPATDSIFAIIAEELGFIGATILILAFLFVFLRGFKIALSAEDSFGRLLATGITSWLAIQTLINLSAMVALVPLTGVPLPLVSYGGSSLLVTLTAIGILLNISKHRTTINRQ